MSRAVHLLGATNSGVDSATAVVAAGAQLWRRPLWWWWWCCMESASASLRNSLRGRRRGYESVLGSSSRAPSLLDEGTHDDWNDDDEFEDAVQTRSSYDETDPYAESDGYSEADPYDMNESAYARGDSWHDYDDEWESDFHREEDSELLSHSDGSDPAGVAGIGTRRSGRTAPDSRSRGVYVEHPHTAFEDVAVAEEPDQEPLPFHPDELDPETTKVEDFPAFFHHKVGEYGEFNWFSRAYLEIRQLFMLLLTTIGLSMVMGLAILRYMNPFRKNYPKARVDFEYERRITGERYSERVQYYAEFWGYQCEEYDIITRGGWILKAHRISDPRRPGGRGYPVVLQHGILCTSLFFFTSEERSLGFWLVDQGFDVWSTNIRSNFGAGHTTYKRWDPRFWAWSLIELGDDLVDVVDFVLRETGYRQLAFVGHSQGTGSMFLALEKYKELGTKLSSFTALGPAVYPGKSLNRLPFRVMRMVPSRWAWSLVFGVREFMPPLGIVRQILPKFLFGHMAYIVFGYLFDFHDHNWVDRHKPKVFCATGVLTSSELLYYWLHCFVARGCVFDPRLRRPWFPPTFPPLTIAYGTIDHLVVGKPLIDRLLAYESNVQIVHILELQGYEHMDMVLGCDAFKVVYPKIKDTIVRTIDPEDVPFVEVPRTGRYI